MGWVGGVGGVGWVGWGGWPIQLSCQPKVQILLFSFFGGLLFDSGACWDKDLDQGLTITK